RIRRGWHFRRRGDPGQVGHSRPGGPCGSAEGLCAGRGDGRPAGERRAARAGSARGGARARSRGAPGEGARGRGARGACRGVHVSHLALFLSATSTADTATGVGIPLALAAGLVSFLSPCVLPLVPGYLSTVIGATPADLRDGLGAKRVLAPSL